MGSFDITAATAALKIRYPQPEIAKYLYKNNPLFAMVNKRTDWDGLNLQIAFRYALTAGRSAVFATAQTLKNPSKLQKFNVTTVKDYSLADIDGETIRATKTDKGALLRALENETDSALWKLKRSIAIKLYRNGTGSIGNISSGSTVASTTITLANIQDVTNFEVGDTVVASAADGGALRAATGSPLTAVNRATGQLTLGINWNAAAVSAVAGDYIYTLGDAAAGGANVVLSGIQAWVPPGTVSATTFFGLDRTPDPTRMAGLRYTGGGAPIEETLQNALALLCREGGEPSHVFMNNADYVNLVLALGSKVIYDQEKTDIPDVGFKGVQIVAPGASGFVKVFADPNCPKGYFHILQLDTWTLWTRGEIGFLMDDDQRILRNTASDSYELRMGYYGNLVCDAPAYNLSGTI